MNTQQPVETKAAAPLDTVLLALAVAAVVGGIVAFYALPDLPVAVRFLMVLGGLGAGATLAYQTQTGKSMWGYIRGAQVELRKTTWPTKQESLQATLMIALIVFLFGVVLWLLDSGLLWAVKRVTEHG